MYRFCVDIHFNFSGINGRERLLDSTVPCLVFHESAALFSRVADLVYVPIRHG